MTLSLRQVVGQQCTVCQQLMTTERRNEGACLQALIGSANYAICCGCYQEMPVESQDPAYRRRWTLRMKLKTRKMISRKDLAHLAFCNSKRLPQVVNDGGVRKRWVGIGWVEEGEPKPQDPIVVDELPSGKRWKGLL